MNRLSLLLLLTFLAANVSGTKFTDCGSSTGKVNSVQVSGCPDTANTCDLTRGTKKEITINFQAESETKTVKAYAHGIIGGVPIPFPLPQSDGCQSGISCPTEKGKSYTYSNALPIKKSYPPLDVTVKWELKDDSGADIVCVEIPCEVK